MSGVFYGVHQKIFTSKEYVLTDVYTDTANTFYNWGLFVDNKWKPTNITNLYKSIDVGQLYWKFTSATAANFNFLYTHVCFDANVIGFPNFQGGSATTQFGVQRVCIAMVVGPGAGQTIAPTYVVGILFYNANKGDYGTLLMSLSANKVGYENSHGYLDSDLIPYDKLGVVTNKSSALVSHGKTQDYKYHLYEFIIDYKQVGALRMVHARICFDEELIYTTPLGADNFTIPIGLFPYLAVRQITTANTYLAVTSVMVHT